MRRALALVTGVALCGCSFVLVHGPKPPPEPPSDCTSSRVVPIIDAAAAGLFAVFGLYSAVSSDEEYRSNFCDDFDSSCTPPARAFSIVTSLAIAAATGVSAYMGRNRVNECRAANYAPVVAPPNPSPSPSPSTTPVPVPVPVSPPPTPTPTVKPAPPTPTPTPTKLKPGSGSGSGELPIPPSGLPVPGAT
jgi:hypothetical protein